MNTSRRFLRRAVTIATLCAVLLSGLLGIESTPASAVTQVIAAGASQTNLPTESVWPGAQNNPYVCCWGSQGQFVTFSFTTAAGSTTLGVGDLGGEGGGRRQGGREGGGVGGEQTFAGDAEWGTGGGGEFY